jgi:RNA-directed DNA polymerase
VRPLGIPTVRDRVAQAAAKVVLEPIFEADFAPGS